MRLFDLYRLEDETGVSGTGVVAQGVVFDDGTCALRWLTANRSTGLYDDVDTLTKIHGHNGRTRVVYRGSVNSFDRGRVDCMQDSFENCPFASVGGLDKRAAIKAPEYIEESEQPEYVRGYTEAARQIYGEGWQTCAFGWAPALTIDGSTADQEEGG